MDGSSQYWHPPPSDDPSSSQKRRHQEQKNVNQRGEEYQDLVDPQWPRHESSNPWDYPPHVSLTDSMTVQQRADVLVHYYDDGPQKPWETDEYYLTRLERAIENMGIKHRCFQRPSWLGLNYDDHKVQRQILRELRLIVGKWEEHTMKMDAKSVEYDHRYRTRFMASVNRMNGQNEKARQKALQNKRNYDAAYGLAEVEEPARGPVSLDLWDFDYDGPLPDDFHPRDRLQEALDTFGIPYQGFDRNWESRDHGNYGEGPSRRSDTYRAGPRQAPVDEITEQSEVDDESVQDSHDEDGDDPSYGRSKPDKPKNYSKRRCEYCSLRAVRCSYGHEKKLPCNECIVLGRAEECVPSTLTRAPPGYLLKRAGKNAGYVSARSTIRAANSPLGAGRHFNSSLGLGGVDDFGEFGQLGSRSPLFSLPSQTPSINQGYERYPEPRWASKSGQDRSKANDEDSGDEKDQKSAHSRAGRVPTQCTRRLDANRQQYVGPPQLRPPTGEEELERKEPSDDKRAIYSTRKCKQCLRRKTTCDLQWWSICSNCVKFNRKQCEEDEEYRDTHRREWENWMARNGMLEMAAERSGKQPSSRKRQSTRLTSTFDALRVQNPVVRRGQDEPKKPRTINKDGRVRKQRNDIGTKRGPNKRGILRSERLRTAGQIGRLVDDSMVIDLTTEDDPTPAPQFYGGYHEQMGSRDDNYGNQPVADHEVCDACYDNGEQCDKLVACGNCSQKRRRCLRTRVNLTYDPLPSNRPSRPPEGGPAGSGPRRPNSMEAFMNALQNHLSNDESTPTAQEDINTGYGGYGEQLNMQHSGSPSVTLPQGADQLPFAAVNNNNILRQQRESSRTYRTRSQEAVVGGFTIADQDNNLVDVEAALNFFLTQDIAKGENEGPANAPNQIFTPRDDFDKPRMSNSDDKQPAGTPNIEDLQRIPQLPEELTSDPLPEILNPIDREEGTPQSGLFYDPNACHEKVPFGNMIRSCNGRPTNLCETQTHGFFCTCNDCYTSQEEKIRETEGLDLKELVKSLRLPVCKGCANDVRKSRQWQKRDSKVALKRCICVAKLQVMWLCLQHKTDAAALVRRRMMLTQEWLTRNFGNYSCVKCNSSADIDESVHKCIACSEIVLKGEVQT